VCFKLLIGLLFLGYVLDITAVAMSNPIIVPKIAPDQGLAVMPQVLPEHLPK
jgi:hypothetical protein